jgi:endonuclease/exonuclease/phosphatase (EEP) superfamily protein YafD
MLSKAEFRGATLALCGIMVVVYLFVSLSPGLPGELLLQSLRFHLVVVGLVLAALAFVFGARWRGLLFLGVVVASAVHGGLFVWDYYQRRAEPVGEQVAQFRFLSFNVLTGNETPEELVAAVLADPPDVMLVMETPGIAEFDEELATVFPYRVGCSGERCDISLHSRFPLENAEVTQLPPFFNERLVTARIAVDGQLVTIAGLHLSKPYFDQASWGELYFIRRALRDVEGPMVVAGDFNAAPWSEPVALLAEELDLVPGPWPAATWPVRLGPLGVPIDNVFTRGDARLLTLEAGDNHGSNHRPLWADVAIYAAE